LIHGKSCKYAFFKFVTLCALQLPFLNLSLCFSFSSHTFLIGYCEKNLMARDRTSILFFIKQCPSSWFLFYLYLYFILLSLPIIITNRFLNLLNHSWTHNNISNESLIELIRQLILTFSHLTHMML